MNLLLGAVGKSRNESAMEYTGCFVVIGFGNGAFLGTVSPWIRGGRTDDTLVMLGGGGGG